MVNSLCITNMFSYIKNKMSSSTINPTYSTT